MSLQPNDKVFLLAKKLKALADRGIGGEKQNAITMLEKLMKTHGITIDMLEGLLITEHICYIQPEARVFFHQVVASELGKGGARPYKFTYKLKRVPGKDRFGLQCTDEEFIYIMAKFEFYYRQYLEDQEIFYSAFIQKNRLYVKPNDDGEKSEDDRPPLTPEEKLKLYKMANMMEGLEMKVFNKQID